MMQVEAEIAYLVSTLSSKFIPYDRIIKLLSMIAVSYAQPISGMSFAIKR